MILSRVSETDSKKIEKVSLFYIEVVVVLLALPDAEEPKVVPTASKRSSQERHKRAVADAACRGLIAAVKDVCAALFRQRDCKVKKHINKEKVGGAPHKCSSRGRCSPARPPQRQPDRLPIHHK